MITPHSANVELVLTLPTPCFVVVVQLLSHIQFCATPWTAAVQASLSLTISRSSLKFIELEMLSNHRILCCPLLLLPSIFPSIRVFFQWVGSSHQVAKILELQLQHHSFQRNPRADLLQNGLVGSPCSPRDSREFSPTPQFESSAFFMVQLSHPYMTTGKTIVLTRWTFVSKVISLLFIMLSRFVIVFLPRSKCLLISWLQSP